MSRRASRRLLGVTALLCSIAGAHAKSVPAVESAAPFYGSVAVGWSYAKPFVMDDTDAVINYDFNPSVVSFAAGVHAFEHWRFELEALFTDNAPEVLYVRGTDVELDTRAGDTLDTMNFLFNAYRDFQIGSAVRPYLGFGFGAAKVSLHYIEYTPVPVYENPLIDDSTWTYAYQVIAGLNVPLGRHFGLGVEYRYWHAPEVDLEDLQGNPLEGEQAIHSGWLRLNYRPRGHAEARTPDPASVAGRGFYLATTLGSVWSPDRDFLHAGGQFDAFDVGPVVAVAAGYQFDRHWRLALDVARFRNVMEIYDTRVEETRTKGHVTADAVSLNVDFRLRPGRAIDPYLGVGFGASRLRYQVDVAVTRSPLIDDTVRPWLLQWALGVDLALSSRWTISTGYRGAFSDHFTLDRSDGDTVTTTYLAHAMTVGARYRF